MLDSASRLCAVWLAIGAVNTVAEAVKDREGAVRKDKAAMENDARWIYNDFERGFAEAKRTGKPLLVVLRCVPCLSCAGIDAQVLEDAQLQPLHDQFVCARIINANALDLAKFQFDYDLSFSTMFFNGDGTVYGRYGSWTHQRDALDRTTAGYRRALEAVLVVHRGYPANRAELAGKQGGPSPFKTPIEIPMLAGKYQRDLDWQGKVVQSCVHCHQIGDALRTDLRDQKKALPEELIYPWPMPETVGLTLAPDGVARIASVVPDSAAARTGLAAGDELLKVGGQRIVSSADVSWVLHRAPATASIAVVASRRGKELSAQLELGPGWRRQSDISRRVGTWPMRAMAFGGLSLEDLPDAERQRRGTGTASLALLVKGVGQHGKHAAAKNAGFKKDDLIVEVDGFSARATEGEMIGRLLTHHPSGTRIKVALLRATQRVELELPMQ